jgi:integrase
VEGCTQKTRYIYCKSKGEAKQALREALKDRDDGIVPPSKMTVGIYLDEWLEDRRETISPRTWKNQESILRCYVTAHIGSQWLSKLSGKDVTRLYRQMLVEGLAASTVGQVHVLLKQAMKDAVRSTYIPSNPTDGVRPPKQRHREVDVLTPDQVKHLLDTAKGDRFEAALSLGACCALRIGETLAIRCSDIDFDKGTITIRRTLWNGKTSQPKTATSYRTLKLPKIALDALRRHCEGREQDGYLFATSNGTPVDASTFYRWSWKPMLRKAGLAETLTYHKLRHGAASLLLSQQHHPTSVRSHD